MTKRANDGGFQRLSEVAQRVLNRLQPVVAEPEQAQSGRNDEITRPAQESSATTPGAKMPSPKAAPGVDHIQCTTFSPERSPRPVATGRGSCREVDAHAGTIAGDAG